MYQSDQLIEWYQKLIKYWEEDAYEMGLALDGEMLEAYRRLVEEEKTLLKDAKKSAQNKLI